MYGKGALLEQHFFFNKQLSFICQFLYMYVSVSIKRYMSLSVSTDSLTETFIREITQIISMLNESLEQKVV